VGFTVNTGGYFIGRKIKNYFNKINYIMSTKDGRPTTEYPLLCPDKRKFTFITGVTLKRQWVLLQQWIQQSADRNQMECEVLTDSGQTVEGSSGHSDTEPTDGTV
jgi:hypothetical protein